MPLDKYVELDMIAGPNGYVAPATEDELAYLSFFRRICKRYNIVFKDADQDEREFVIRMVKRDNTKNKHKLHLLPGPRKGSRFLIYRNRSCQRTIRGHSVVLEAPAQFAALERNR